MKNRDKAEETLQNEQVPSHLWISCKHGVALPHILEFSRDSHKQHCIFNYSK